MLHKFFVIRKKISLKAKIPKSFKDALIKMSLFEKRQILLNYFLKI